MAEQDKKCVEDEFYLVFRDAVSLALLSKFPEIPNLKPKQEEALRGFMTRRDVFAVLPTGSGKSLIFQIVPEICLYLHNHGFPYPKNAILLIICPLNALINSHLRELEHRGIKACTLKDGMFEEDDLLSGKYSMIFTNPETLVQNDTWRAMLKSSVYQENLFGIVADEAHIVPKW